MSESFDQEQEQLLNWVYARFRGSNVWPTALSADIAFRATLDPRRVAAELGPAYIRSDGGAPDAVWYLTLRSLASRPNAAEDIDKFLAALRYMAATFVRAQEPIQISSERFVRELGFTQAEARRAAEVIRREDDLVSSSTVPPAPGWVSFTPARLAARLEDVPSLYEYWRACAQLEDAGREIAARYGQKRARPRDYAVPTPRPGWGARATAWLEAERAKRGIVWVVVAAGAGLLLAAVGLCA